MPEKLKDAGNKYRNEMDTLGQFIEDKCNVNPDYSVKVSELHSEYQKWSEENLTTNKVLGLKSFSQKMEERFIKDKRRDANYFIGIELDIFSTKEETQYPGIKKLF